MIASHRRLLQDRSLAVTLALVFVLAAGFGLRLFGLDWDEAHYLHPDERHIVADVMVGRLTFEWPLQWSELLDPATSPINPRPFNAESGTYEGFAYGTLPLYATELLGALLTEMSGTDWNVYGRAHYLGRALSILLDTVTILIVFLLGRRISGDGAGLLGAFFYASAPIAFQLSHFFTVESWITFFVSLCLLASIKGAERGSVRSFALAGGAAGLALASKSSVAAIAVPLAVAVAWDAWRRFRRGYPLIGIANAWLARMTVAAAAFLVTFAIGEPFALLDPRAYLDSLQLQLEIQSGRFDVPFTRQYVETPRLLYQSEQLIRWGLGPTTGILALVGIVLLVWRVFRRPRGALAVLLAWLIAYGISILVPESKFLRYLLPITPVLTAVAGAACVLLVTQLRRWGGRPLALAALAVVVLLSAGWTTAFASVYARPHPRLEASAWLLQHAPAGSTTSNEIWDDRLPISLTPGLDGFSRRIDGVDVNLYQDFPTEGDARVLVPALNSNEVTSPVAGALESRDYAQAGVLLRGRLVQELASLDSAARLDLSGELSRAASRMTTSPELQAATLLSAETLLKGEAADTPAFLALADAITALPARTAGAYIYDALSRTDFYVLSSNRVLTAMDRSPWRYPVQDRFYELLFAEELGFHLAQEFTNYPRLGGLVFADDAADESFINYDHPHVWIFEKNQLIDRGRFSQLLAPAALQQTVPGREPPDDSPLMLDRPVGELPVVDDARWSASLTDNSWWALTVWVVLLIALQVAGWPLAAVAFGGFPDRGWAAGRLVALLVAGWFVWFLASIEAIAFRAIWCAIAVLVVALAGFALRTWAARRRIRIGGAGWRAIAPPEAVFWAVFLLFLLYRYLNPDSWHPIWGGEKPMEFAHLNAILRSAHFPPVDPWYAGGYINYYYYGTYLIAYMTKLTGIPSEIAFNLAQPTIIALLAAMAYTVASALGGRLSGRPRLGIVGGLGGVFFVTFAGNMMAAARLLETALNDVGPVDPFGYWVWDPRQVIPFTINEFPYFTALYADLHAHVVAWPITILVIALAFSLARDQRTLLLAGVAPRRFSGARTLVLVRLVLLALALGSLAPTNAWDVATYAALAVVALVIATAAIRPFVRRLTATLVCILAVVSVAALAFLPFFVHYVALYRSLGTVRDPTPFTALLTHFGGFLALLLVGIVVMSASQSRAYRLRWLDPAASTLVVTSLLLIVWYARTREPTLEDAANAVVVVSVTVLLFIAVSTTLSRHGDFGIPRPAVLVMACAFAAATVLALFFDRTAMALYLAFGLPAVLGWLTWKRPTERFVAAMIAGGMLVGASLEVVFLVDNLESIAFYRMNTVFKFYNQLWILFALVAAAMVPLLIDRASRRERVATPAAPVQSESSCPPGARIAVRPEGSIARPWARIGIGLTVAIALSALAFPMTATLPRLETRFTDELGSSTLNALDWMRYGTVETSDGEILRFSEDRAVIGWFNSKVEGTPVIAEASFGPYRCNGSRISIATGLPAVIGWVNHESQQRDPGDLQAREAALRTLYTSTDIEEKRQVIGRYNIEYIVVGNLERHYPSLNGYGCRADGSPAGISVLQEMVGEDLAVAFRSGDTIVYRVI